jgi:hypothetical protein
MNAEEIPAYLTSLRASMSTIQAVVRKSCGASDLRRAAQNMGVFISGSVESPRGEGCLEMVADLAIFEPNEHGVRPYNRFLNGPVRTLPEREQEIAQRIGRSFFSIFRLAEKHETTGLWVEDILNDRRRVWLVDLNVDEPNPSHTAFAVRVFDAGPFHVTLCVVTSISERMFNVFERAHVTGRRPYRRSLPATIYGLAQLNGQPPLHASGRRFVADMGPELQPGGRTTV